LAQSHFAKRMAPITWHTADVVTARRDVIRVANDPCPDLSTTGPTTMPTKRNPVPINNHCHHARKRRICHTLGFTLAFRVSADNCSAVQLCCRSQLPISPDCAFDASLVPETCRDRFVDLSRILKSNLHAWPRPVTITGYRSFLPRSNQNAAQGLPPPYCPSFMQ